MVQHVVTETRAEYVARNRLFLKWAFIIITLFLGIAYIGSNLILGILLLLPFIIWLIRKIRKKFKGSHHNHHKHYHHGHHRHRRHRRH